MKKLLLGTIGGVFLISLAYTAFKEIANDYLGIFSQIPNNIENFDHYVDLLQRIRLEYNQSYSGVSTLEKERIDMEIHYAQIAQRVLKHASHKQVLQN